MQNFDIILFNSDAFVEYSVKSMYANIKNLETNIIIDGGWLERKSDNYLSVALINIRHWKTLEINLYNEDNSKIEKIDVLENCHAFERIIDFNFIDGNLKLAGFGVDCGWMEWIFINPIIDIQCELRK